jgi:hypothetical protein
MKMANHSWDEEVIKEYGNARCSKCGIQYEYAQRGIRDMGDWTKEDIEAEPDRYEQIMKTFKECKPRH